MTTEIVADDAVIAAIRGRGGALYVWPRKARCCGGTVTLEAATERPDREFRQLEAGRIDLFLSDGMTPPGSLHVEIDRRGRVRAFWNGLAWVGPAGSTSGRASPQRSTPPQASPPERDSG
jgi:hypothetical protein